MGGTNRAVSNRNGNIMFSIIDGTTDVIEDTADAWDESSTVNVTSDTTTSDGPTSSDPGAPPKDVTVCRAVCASVAAGAIIVSETISSTDLSGQDALTVYFKTDTAFAAGDVLFQVDDTALLASPLESIAMPAISGDNVGVWNRMKLNLANPSLDLAIITLGWKYKTGVTVDFEIQWYVVRQMREIQGMKNFAVPQAFESLDSTDYQSGNRREFEFSYESWTLSFGGNKEGAPPLKGSQRYTFAAQEDNVAGRDWIGDGFLTSLSEAGDFASLITYDFAAQGDGFLMTPVA